MFQRKNTKVLFQEKEETQKFWKKTKFLKKTRRKEGPEEEQEEGPEEEQEEGEDQKKDNVVSC